MKTSTMMTSAMPRAPVGKAWEEVSASFDRFCLAAGIETLGAMMEADAEVACGPRHSRSEDRRGNRGGRTRASLGAHGGQDRLPCWQGRNRATSGARAQWERTAAGKLGASGQRGLAPPVGGETDVDHREGATGQS